MQRQQDFVRLTQLPSAKMNDIQDAAAPVDPFVGYRRGGDIYTKAANKILYIAPMELCIGADGEETGSQIVEASIDTTGLTAVSSWHYLFATLSGGVFSYEIGRDALSTGPDVTLVYQDGDTSKRFLGSFYCDGSNNILPFMKHGTRYLYRRSQAASTVFRFFNAAAAAAWAAQSLVALVPPHARVVSVELKCTNTTAVNQTTMGVRTTGDTTFEAGRAITPFSGGSIETGIVRCEVECNTSNQIDVDVVSTGGTVTANGYVLGFDERSV